MKIELAHDILAKKVGDKITGEEKQFRQVQSFLNKRYEEFKERGESGLLGKDDIQYINPYIKKLSLSPETETFFNLSKSKQRRKTILLGVIVSIISSIILIFSGISFINYKLLLERRNKADLTTLELEKKENKLKGINEALETKRREATDSEKEADTLAKKLNESKNKISLLDTELAKKLKMIGDSFNRMREEANSDDSEYRKWISDPANWTADLGEMNWTEARSKCANMAGGYRLPSRKDWTIIFGSPNPVFQKWKAQSDWFWTKDEKSPSIAYGFLIEQGVTHFDDKGVKWHARCVK